MLHQHAPVLRGSATGSASGVPRRAVPGGLPGRQQRAVTSSAGADGQSTALVTQLVAQPVLDLITRHATDSLAAASHASGALLQHLAGAAATTAPSPDALADALAAAAAHHTTAAPDTAGAASTAAFQPIMDLAHNAAAATAASELTPDVAASVAASYAAGAGSLHASQLSQLAAWAVDKLAVVQSMDPAAYDSLRTSVDGVMANLQAVVADAGPASPATPHLPTWTNALVLGVQQLVTTLRAPGTGGASIEAMLAAQEAMQAALVSAAGAARAVASGSAAGELPAGLNGLLQFALAIIAMVIAAVPKGGAAAAGQGGGDQVPLRYDVPALHAYFSRRPMLVLRRNTEVVSRLSSFCIAILTDWRTGQWDARIHERAIWARKIVEDLGPTYIKIAQAVATRVDVMPKVYIDELARLHDNVRTFSTVEARKVLEEGLQQPVDAVFDWLSEEPIAAASLGQVYRGKLRDELGGAEVAVKVQRPGSLESAALDIFVMRRSAVLFSQIPGMSDKWASALDDWAVRFFQEMDYELEAHNTMTFKRHMAGLEGVRVATVYPQLTSRRVIVTEWIEGQRLADSSSEDVRALCSTLLNCYLIQLLETGLLHADPHPGNLLRTPDGKIVVLDFGLMTEVTEDQRVALVEYIAHLTVEDWEAVSLDLVKLGFMPDGLPPEAAPLIAPVMQKVMGQLVRGGGLGGFNITDVASELSGVAMNYKLAIPPYFALVLRAFSVIEGIALKVDPQYAIVQECMPYMSRRLLTDKNPRMRAALRQLLYGNGTRLDMDRLQRMLASFGAFTTAAAPTGPAALPGPGGTSASTSSSQQAPRAASHHHHHHRSRRHHAQPQPRLATGPTFSSAATYAADGSAVGAGAGGLLGVLMSLGGDDDGPILTEPVKEVLRVVFSKDGSYAQEILVDEAVAAIDAMSREALGEALRVISASTTTVAALRGLEALGPLRAMLMPVPLPTDLLLGMQPAVALTREDRQALSTLRTVLDLLVGPAPGSPGGPGVAQVSVKAARVASEVAPMLPELLPGMQATLELFTRQLLRRMALRLAEDLDPQRGSGAAAAAAAVAAAAPAPAPSTGAGQQAARGGGVQLRTPVPYRSPGMAPAGGTGAQGRQASRRYNAPGVRTQRPPTSGPSRG